MIQIDFVNETDENTSALEQVAKKLVQVTENYLNLSLDTELTYVFVNNERIKELNRTFRNKDIETDVLTFPGDEEGYLADIFISIDEVKLLAIDLASTFEVEMQFMFVHGLLHALGYDHETSKEDEIEMFRIQDEILSKYTKGL